MDHGKENSRSLLLGTGAAGYGESRPRRKRSKRKAVSRSSSMKSVPLQERADITQHRKRADRNTIATICGLSDDSALSASKTADWQSNKQLKDAIAVISRNRITQQVGKVGIYNQAKISQPVQRESEGSASSQNTSQTGLLVQMGAEPPPVHAPIALSSANLSLHNQLIMQRDQEQQQQQQRHQQPHLPLGLHTAGSRSGPLPAPGCQVSVPGGAAVSGLAASGAAGKDGKRFEKEVDDICVRLAHSIKPDKDFNISYREQLMSELRNMSIECVGTSWSPICSSTPTATRTRGGPRSGSSMSPRSHRESAAALLPSLESTMSVESTPVRSTVPTLIDVSLPMAHPASSSSPRLAVPSTVLQKVVEQQYPLNVQAGAAISTTFANASAATTDNTVRGLDQAGGNPLSIFTDVISSQMMSSGADNAAHTSTTSLACDSGLGIMTSSGGRTRSSLLDQQVASNLAAASSRPHVSMYQSDVHPARHASTSAMASAAVGGGGGASFSHCTDSKDVSWNWSDPVMYALDDASRLRTAQYEQNSRRASSTHSPHLGRSAMNMDHARQQQQQQQRRCPISRSQPCVYTSLSSTNPASDLATRHSVLELLPPQLHHRHDNASKMAAEPCARSHSNSVQQRQLWGRGVANSSIPGTYSTLHDPLAGDHLAHHSISAAAAPVASANPVVGGSQAAVAAACVPDFLDVLEHDQLSMLGAGRGGEGFWSNAPPPPHRLAAELLPLTKPGGSPSPPDFKLFPQKMY